MAQCWPEVHISQCYLHWHKHALTWIPFWDAAHCQPRLTCLPEKQTQSDCVPTTTSSTHCNPNSLAPFHLQLNLSTHAHTPISIPWQLPRTKSSLPSGSQLFGKPRLCWQPKFTLISFLLKSWEFLFTDKTHLYFTGSHLWVTGGSTRLFKGCPL